MRKSLLKAPIAMTLIKSPYFYTNVFVCHISAIILSSNLHHEWEQGTKLASATSRLLVNVLPAQENNCDLLVAGNVQLFGCLKNVIFLHHEWSINLSF